MSHELFLGNFSLWSCMWQSTIFIMVGMVSSFILRHRSSRAHQVLFLAMIAAVIVPAMGALVNHLDLGVFVDKPVVMQPLADPESDYGASVEGTDYKPDVIEENLASATISSKNGKFPWRLMFLYGWVIASLILVTRLFVTFALGVHLLGRALPLNCKEIAEAVHIATAKLKLAKDLRVYSSNGICSPVIWCWSKRPILLLPTNAEKPGNKIDWVSVLCHELAHYKRRDHISGLAAELMVCALPWNPLLWRAKSRLIKLSEQACDDWVVALGQSGTDYAESLLDLAPGGQMAFVPAVVTSKKGLAGRVTRILKDKCGNPTIGLRWAIVAGVVAGLMAIGVAFAQTRPAEPQAKPKPEAKTYKTLHEAAAAGDIEQVKSLISKGADVNAKDRMGRTALHSAAEKGHIDIVKFLIDRGADINAKTRNQGTPLHNAAMHKDNKKTVELLIDKGADVNAKNTQGATPLHYAAMVADKKTVEFLIDKGADINAKNTQGATPLYEAMTSTEAGRKEVVELLVAKGAKVSAFHLVAYMGDIERLKKCLEEGININTPGDCNSTALHLAANSGKKDIVEFLISKGAHVDAKNAYGLTPLYHAASHNYEDIADLLLDKGADVNAKAIGGYTQLCWAIWEVNKEAVKLLINKGANVNVRDERGYTPLVWAIWIDDKDIVELLINKGADVNAEDKDGYTPLYWATIQGSKDLVDLLTAKGATAASTIHLAAATGDLDKVKEFIEKGTDLNAKDKSVQTPLHWAVLADNNDVAKFLIAKGADVNAKDNNGQTPLHQVCLRGRKDMAELLIAKGADVNAKNEQGRTPLDVVASRGDKDMAALLIAKGADVNTKNRWGNTPLHIAGKHGHVDVAKFLLSKGADVNAENNLGGTPLHIAAREGHSEIVELLRKHGAKE